ncbi:MAG TPA: hypothetical protein VF747_06670 [Blastocatellia bacterium]|jgi:hypothetical protein
MAEVKVIISGYRAEGLAARLNSAFAEEGRAFMATATEKILGTWQASSPVDIGAYRNSQTASVEVGGSQITGAVGTPINYGSVLEQGRRAGSRQPPTAALEGWVARKLGIADPKTVRSVAFLVARRIGERGLPAKRPLAKALEENQAFIKQLFEVDFAAAIAKRL